MISAVSGYYGKLPTSPEFLRLHAAGPELRWLDDWLQRGVLYAKSKERVHWSTLIAQSDVWNFMFAPAEKGRIVCGALFMSQDKAGRSFPFLTFLLLERESLSKHLWLVPLMVSNGLAEFNKLLQQLKENLDWPLFCKSLENVRNPSDDIKALSETFARYLQTATVKEWVTSEGKSCDEDRTHRLSKGFENWISFMKELANRHDIYALKIPLSPRAVAAPFDVSFWLAMLIRSMGRGQGLGMLVFWNRNSNKVNPCAMISLGPGSPNVLRFLVAPQASDDSWRDILVGDYDGNGSTARTLPLHHQDASLQQLLDYIGSVA